MLENAHVYLLYESELNILLLESLFIRGMKNDFLFESDDLFSKWNYIFFQ